MDHRHPDHRLAHVRAAFVVFAEPPVAPQPAEGPLDDPAMRQELPALYRLIALDDSQHPGAALPCPRLQLAGITPVGPDPLASDPNPPHPCQHLLRPDAVL